MVKSRSGTSNQDIRTGYGRTDRSGNDRDYGVRLAHRSVNIRYGCGAVDIDFYRGTPEVDLYYANLEATNEDGNDSEQFEEETDGEV